MGRVGYEAVIQHFSHPHAMEITNLQDALTPATCAGCKLRASGWAYACRACSYHLHITCSQVPRRIRHPADPTHPLTLLPVPAYPEGSFRCDACGRPGTGFSYRCGYCGLDLHALCAAMPLSVTHHAHPHPLALAFSAPYGPSSGFSCDICAEAGSNHWLYRCAACEFDAHLGCATARQPQPQRQQLQPLPVHSRSWHGHNSAVAAPAVVDRTGSSSNSLEGGSGGLLGDAVQGFVESAAQQAGQNLVQTVFGGGGGSSDYASN
ncbi:hypothetical protein Taro_019103 [Colocasia esculenta]|uniref:DC1 domain-containing protein n=1 Tax=Colocasia esculenta TaxID=4460 RepID=A0A843UVG5_COLES|nr:hypothetical protein [Colocasia esculenta]